MNKKERKSLAGLLEMVKEVLLKKEESTLTCILDPNCPGRNLTFRDTSINILSNVINELLEK